MHEGYILQLNPHGGRIHPTKRRPDMYFRAPDTPDCNRLRRLDPVSFSYGDDLDSQGRRCAVDVRLAETETPPAVLTDPTLRARAAPIERYYDTRRHTIAQRWEAGELSIDQRAALYVNVEYARAMRLRKLITRPNDNDNTTDKEIDSMAATERQAGSVTRLTDRGFGFITQDGAHRSVFFHASGVTTEGGFDALTLHQPVSFMLASDDTGRPRAVDVRTVREGANEEDGDDNDGENSYDWGQSA